MKKNSNCIMWIIAICLLLNTACKNSPSDPENNPPSTIDIGGEYFGQAPPGRTLQPFATNIIGSWNHAGVTFSPDGQNLIHYHRMLT